MSHNVALKTKCTLRLGMVRQSSSSRPGHYFPYFFFSFRESASAFSHRRGGVCAGYLDIVIVAPPQEVPAFSASANASPVGGVLQITRARGRPFPDVCSAERFCQPFCHQCYASLLLESLASVYRAFRRRRHRRQVRSVPHTGSVWLVSVRPPLDCIGVRGQR